MKYLVSEVENWGKEIDALSAPDPGRRKVGKREAVFLLAKKLQAATRRGFSTAELLEVLASKGLTVHVDTFRAALKVGGRRAATSPVRNRESAGPLRGLPDGNGTEAETTAGRRNAGVSGGDRPEQRAEVDAETHKPACGSDADGPESAPESSTEAGPDTGPTKGPELVGEMVASRPGRGGGEDGSPQGVTAVAAGVELPATNPHEVGAGTDERASSVSGPGKQVEAGGRGGAAPVGVARAGRDALGGRGAEGRQAALAPVRGSFTPREDSDEI